MRRPSLAQLAVLREIGNRPDALRYDARLRPSWWIEGGTSVRPGVARALVNAELVTRTTSSATLLASRFTRSAVGRAALDATNELPRGDHAEA